MEDITFSIIDGFNIINITYRPLYDETPWISGKSNYPDLNVLQKSDMTFIDDELTLKLQRFDLGDYITKEYFDDIIKLFSIYKKA